MKSVIINLIIGLFLVNFIGCSPKLANKLTKDVDYISYPKDVDTARVQFLTFFSSSKEIEKKQSAFESSIVGERQQLKIDKPFGVQISNGKIFVCDLSMRTVEILDLENQQFSFLGFGKQPKLRLPLNSASDKEENLYVVDPMLGEIQVYDQNEKLVRSFGKEELIRPTDIFLKGNNIYIVDTKNNRVNIFDKNTFELVDHFPKTVVGNDDWLYTPTNIFVTDKRIYVSDMGAYNVKVFSLEGEHILNIGSLGRQPGYFTRPKGVAADKDDNVYVVDGAFENVQVFNKDGELLMYFGGTYQSRGDFYLPTQITIDYDHLEYFKKYVNPKYDLQYLILVANQYGPEKISVYGRVELK